MITPALLRAVGASLPNSQKFAPLMEVGRTVVNDSFNTITSKTGVAMFVAQTSHESGMFGSMCENLNYQVSALKKLKNNKGVRYFTDKQAEDYGALKDSNGGYIKQADQRMVANLYYGGRMGNRGVDTDDGWMFRGAGLIQLTGRTNHTRLGNVIGKSAEETAEYARTPEGAVVAAYWYWRSNGLLIPASHGDVAECTRLIQGNNYPKESLMMRIALYKKALVAVR